MREETYKMQQFVESMQKLAEPTYMEKNSEEMKMRLELALYNDLTVEIKFFDEPHYRTAKSKILGMDPLSGKLTLENGTEINIDSMLDVYID